MEEEVRALRMVVTAFLFSAAASTEPAVAQQPDVPNRNACCGHDYNYLAVCIFEEMVAGYVLPPLDDRFFRSNRRLKKLPEREATSNPGQFWDAYEYRGGGLTGTIMRSARGAFFESFRLNGSRIPAPLRIEQNLLDLLGIRIDRVRADEVETGCEQWSLRFRFSGNKLEWVEIHDSKRAYD